MYTQIVLLLNFLVSTTIATYELFRSICKNGFRRGKSSEGKVTNITPVSLLEVKVTLPTKVIFGDESTTKNHDLSELAQLPKVRLGESTLGTIFKVVLNCGNIITIRKIKEGLVGSNDLESWISFFGGICDPWLLSIQFSFWYGGEVFLLYEYMCLGSLEELLHGSEGIQFTPLDWGARKHIALCAAKAVASLHTRLTRNGEALVCGVIKATNILLRMDFSACLSGYETPYLVSPATIIRRNPGRIAPELTKYQNSPKRFTKKSDVYSFGVLLLELITGKRPTVNNLKEYVLEKRNKEDLIDTFDKHMGDVKENMYEMVAIAQFCLLNSPQNRPSMDTVVQKIQGLQD